MPKLSLSRLVKGLRIWVQGCGKTVEVLALAMANPAPALTLPRGQIDQEGRMQSQCAHRLQILVQVRNCGWLGADYTTKSACELCIPRG